MNMLSETFFTRQEICATLRIGAGKIKELEEQGKLNPVRLGKILRYRSSEIEEMLQNSITPKPLNN